MSSLSSVSTNRNFFRSELIKIGESTTISEFEKQISKATTLIPSFKISNSLTFGSASIITQAVEATNITLLTHILKDPLIRDLIDIGDLRGHTPLHRAAINASSTAIRILIAHGANLNIESTFRCRVFGGLIKAGTTPLWIAVWNNIDLDTIKLMIANGAVYKGGFEVDKNMGAQELADKVNQKVADVIKQAKL